MSNVAPVRVSFATVNLKIYILKTICDRLKWEIPEQVFQAFLKCSLLIRVHSISVMALGLKGKWVLHIQQNNNTLGDVNQRVNLICLEFHWLCFFSVLISCFLSFLPKKQEGLEQSRWKKNIKLEARKIVSSFDRVSLDELLGQPLSCQCARRESKSGNRFQLCQNCCEPDEIANAYLKFF